MRYLDMNFSIFKMLKNAKKAKCDRQTNRPTDRPPDQPTGRLTDRPTDRPTQCLVESRARD